MKWDDRMQPKTKKSPLIEAAGPLHRFYQPRSWEKNFSMIERRRKMAATHAVDGQEGHLHPLFQNHWHAVEHRQQGQTAHLLQKNAQESVQANFSINSTKARSFLRVVWLQQKLQQQPKALAVRTRFSDVGMQVNLHQLEMEEITPLDGELIVLECFGMFDQEMMKVLLKIRLFTKAPLIILTDNYTLDWSMRALHTGADAIFTINMPDDVIIARSKALLRRWVPN